MADKVVDATQETAETEAQDTEIVDVASLQERLSNVEELLEHFKSEASKYKEEAKRAFEKRDKVKNELKTVKQADNRNEEIEAHIRTLEEKLTQREQELLTIRNESTKKEKVDALKKVAKEQGLKELYLDKLDRFVDLDEVDTSKAATLRYQVDIIRSNYPDFFQATGKEIDSALPAPRLGSGDPLNQAIAEFKQLKSKGLRLTNDEAAKLAELYKYITDLGGKIK
jgi:DNA repair exonuclease SbcCD ATPase subunit